MKVRHWGDVDEGGFRIAARIAKVARETGHILWPYHMSPEHVPEQMRVPASAATLIRMQRFAKAAGCSELGAAVVAAGFTAEQERSESFMRTPDMPAEYDCYVIAI